MAHTKICPLSRVESAEFFGGLLDNARERAFSTRKRPMRLTDKGDRIAVELTVPETKTLTKAVTILRKVAMVPGDEQEVAESAKESVETILAALAPAEKE